MKINLIAILLLGLVLSYNYVDQKEETAHNKAEVLQKEKREETLGVFPGAGEVSNDKSVKKSRAISIPAGTAGHTQSLTTGIPAGKTSSIGWLHYFLLSLSFSAFIGWLVFKKRYATISTTGTTTIQELHQEDSDEDSRDVASTDAVEDNEEAKQITRIKEFMVAEQPYLDPEFTIKTMADQLDMEVRELSLLINTCFQQNFYDFLNHYRIEKAKKILKDPENKKVTILEVLYSVGFNSKSSFNTSFKKLSGLTPTQYRQKYRR